MRSRCLHPTYPAWLLGFLFLLPGTTAHAQVILNTERFQLAEVTGFHLSGDASVDVQRGNSRILDLSTAGMVGVLEGRHWTRVIFGGRYLSDEERSLLDQQFVQLRYSYIFARDLRTFHFIQAQKNETLLLRSRWLLGSGIRRTFVETERTSVSAGTGLMWEWERLDRAALGPGDPGRLQALRIANLGVWSVDLQGGARILNIFYLQPDVGELGDMRILNELGLLVPITHWIRATASLEWRRDTRPPSELGRDDVNFRIGLGVEFR
jgi:hypothetical protein